MSIIYPKCQICGNPVADADRYYRDLEHRNKYWLRGNANCCRCDRLITDLNCTVLDEKRRMASALCDRCRNELLEGIRGNNQDAKIRSLIFFEDLLNDMREPTPHDDYKE